MLSVNRKSYVIGHVMTLRIFDAPKSCSLEEYQKGAQSTQLCKLS